MDEIVFGNIHTTPAVNSYRRIMGIMKDAEANNTPFMETLLAYVECGGSMEKTSNLLHQHKNTVRYRMDKIQKLFDEDDEITFMGKIYYFVRTYHAMPFLENLI